jgi:hypothetical protein
MAQGRVATLLAQRRTNRDSVIAGVVKVLEARGEQDPFQPVVFGQDFPATVRYSCPAAVWGGGARLYAHDPPTQSRPGRARRGRCSESATRRR